MMHYILIEDQGAETRLVLTDSDLHAKFTQKQIDLMNECRTVICNTFYGNDWVKGRNATACNMLAIARMYRDRDLHVGRD